LIALQYHEVKVNIELASLTEITQSDAVTTVASFIGRTIASFNAASQNTTAVALTNITAGATLSAISTAPTGTPITNMELWADYIYLDVDERKRFAQVSHEYLIDQL
jgi:hypothetical protein